MSKERIGEKRAVFGREVGKVSFKGAIARLGVVALVAAIAVATDQGRHGVPTAEAQSIVRLNDIPPDQLIEYDGPVESYCQPGQTDGLWFAPAYQRWWVQRFIHRETRELAYQRQLAQSPDCQDFQLPVLQFGPEPTPTTGVAVVPPTPGVVAQAERGVCFPPARTTFSSRADAEVNGTKLHADVRDLPSCIHALWHTETGIDDPTTSIVEGAQNFKVTLPSGWSVVVSPTTVAVHREGGVQRNFTDGEVVVVDGPFVGGVGVYEGWIGAMPTEWASVVANERLALQRQQKPGAQLVTFQG